MATANVKQLYKCKKPLAVLAAVVSLVLVLQPGDAKQAHRNALGKLSSFMRTRNFVVRYEPEDPFLARLLAQTAEDELRRIAKDLGYEPTGNRPFTLYVFRSHADFVESGGLEIDKLTVGTASLGTDEIAVDASGVFDLPERILAHEITHAVVFRLLGPLATELPLWMHEGLAGYESRELSGYDDEIIATAAAEGSVIPLFRLRKSFPKSRTGLAYAESASAVRFMVARFGRAAPRMLILHLQETYSMDKAMVAVTGRNLSAFEQEWLAEISKRYSGLRWIRLATAFVSVLMAALAIAAYLARRNRSIEEADGSDDECWDTDFGNDDARH
ncbi:MAG: peptidase MA family metallohydrolase [Armatimonadota bacterium]|nr:peptidase MA family metallohydrolase [Armatimonadota bacterium]